MAKDIILLELDFRNNITQKSNIIMITADIIMIVDKIVSIINDNCIDDASITNDSCT